MSHSETTCWTVIHDAAAGDVEARAQFARRYGPVVRTYLAARWQSSPYLRELDDAVQEVFVECFKRGGALERVDENRGFRPFLYGVARNVALRIESQLGRQRKAGGEGLSSVADDEPSLARTFDRAWAKELMRQAAQLQEERARRGGDAAVRRVELLRLRFHESLPIRAIAERWAMDAKLLHHEYAKARQEFKAALVHIVTLHHFGTPAEFEQECANLLELLA
jgi:RNA polymerase sigma factor (sigma-70 family)